MKFSDYIIYVDESGDSSLESIDRDYPAFVLNFCILRKDHYANVVVPAIQEFKFVHFGHDIVILHEHEIRLQLKPFIFLKPLDKRAAFMDGLNRLIGEAVFTIVAAVVRKGELVRDRDKSQDTYESAMACCMESAYAFLREAGQLGRTTHIVLERRGRREDSETELAFRRICDGANRLGTMPEFEIIFADKRTNSAGLQLADLTARPIGRHFLDPGQSNRAWDIIERKLHRGPGGEVDGWGVRRVT